MIHAARKRWPDDDVRAHGCPLSLHLYRGELEAAATGRAHGSWRSIRVTEMRCSCLATPTCREVTTRRRVRATRKPTRNSSRQSLRRSTFELLSRNRPRARLAEDGRTRARQCPARSNRGRSSERFPAWADSGYWITDVQIYALRGQKAKALAALRAAEKAGWRVDWRYYRDFDPNLASIRNEPEFKAVFADIERDMARAARPPRRASEGCAARADGRFEVTDTPTERGAESTWTRLRRRKVVQWGVVYVAAAWGFLQGLEYLSGTYRLAASDPAAHDPRTADRPAHRPGPRVVPRRPRSATRQHPRS